LHAGVSNRCPEPGEGTQVTQRAPEEHHKVIPATPASKPSSTTAQFKCLYANTCSMGNKREELGMCTCLQGYDLIDITEKWWDISYHKSVGIEGQRFFRKNRHGR